MKKQSLIILGILLSLFCSMLVLEPFTVQAQEISNGDITFQPNVIPLTTITFNNSRFVFDWYGNHFEVAMFTSGEDFEYEFEVEEGKTKLKVKVGDFEFEEEVESEVVVDEFNSNITWGINLWDIPSEISNYIENILFKIVNANFGVSDIEVEVIELETYNISRFLLPNNLVLSYEDLWLYNFTISHPNKLETKVEGIKGKSNWNLDPYTFSAGIITITGSPTNFAGWYSADQAGGWDTIDTVKNNATLQFGQIMSVSLKTVRYGVHVMRNNYIQSESGSTVYLYSCDITMGQIKLQGSNRLWGNVFDGCRVNAKDTDCYNNILNNAFFEGTEYEMSGIIDRVTVYGSYLLYTTKTFSSSISNAKGQVLYVIRTHSLYDWTGEANLTNIETNTWDMSFVGDDDTGEAYRQYTFDLTITYKNGTSMENANVTIINDYLETSDSWLTYANGSIPPQTYRMGHYNKTGGNTIYDYNPYNITVTRDGLQTYTALFNITEKTDLTIALLDEIVTETDPVARFTYTPTLPSKEQEVTFDASDSLDPDGGTLTYSWDFGDGNSSTGVSPTNTYVIEGLYTVNLTVTDDESVTNSFQEYIYIAHVGGSGFIRVSISEELYLLTRLRQDITIKDYIWNRVWNNLTLLLVNKKSDRLNVKLNITLTHNNSTVFQRITYLYIEPMEELYYSTNFTISFSDLPTDLLFGGKKYMLYITAGEQTLETKYSLQTSWSNVFIRWFFLLIVPILIICTAIYLYHRSRQVVEKFELTL